MINVLFCGLAHEYGHPGRGISFERKHIYGSLERMDGVKASFFAIDEEMTAHGRDSMNKRLIEKVELEKPDVLFCFLFTEEIKKETIRYITEKTKTKTFNWFGDDHWRFPIFSRYWAPLFTLVSTTDGWAYEKYKRAGISNVMKTQWAANPFLYQPQDTAADPHIYNITFYGQQYGNRPYYIQKLVEAGLPAVGHGRGWPAGGGTTVEEMLALYSFSKINLNFSETPYYGFKKKLNLFAKLFVKKELGTYKFDAHHIWQNIQAAIGTQRRTIKARTFEVPACGGFLLTAPSDDPIDEYYIPGKEIVVFHGVDDLIEKSRYYLSHEKERKTIAQAGYERTVREHTYLHRFQEIFSALNLKF